MSDLSQDPAYQEMAKLVNFNPSTPSNLSTDDTDEPHHHPEDSPSPRRFAQMGTTRAGFVLGSMSLVALVVGLLTDQIFRPTPIKTTNPNEPTYEAGDRLTLSLEPPGESGELGALRTEVALKDQAQDLQELEVDAATDINDPVSIDEPETSQTDPQPEETPVQTAAATPRPVAQPAPTPSVISQQPIQPSFMPVAQPIVETTPIDPWETWQQFAKSGTHGQVKLVAQRSSPQPAARNPAPNLSPRPTVTRRSGTIIGPARTVPSGTNAQSNGITGPPRTPSVAQAPTPSLDTYINGRPPIPGLRHPSTQTIPIGTTATATVTTPILWPGEGTQSVNSRAPETPKYIVTLEEPLIALDEQIVFPRGAQLIVTAVPLDMASGMATLDVLSILRDGQAYTVPAGQLHIRGKNGTPLMAQRFHDPGGAIFSMDAGLFVISGLENLGTLLNRPRSSTVVNSDFQGTITNDFNDPNFLGAILEGGAGALAERLASRNEQAIADLAQQPNTWYLPAGTEVQLFVNQPMRI